MSSKRVICHFLRPAEAQAVQRVMSDVHLTESFAIGDVDEAEIAGLRERGLVVQVLDEAQRPAVPAAGALARRPTPGVGAMLDDDRGAPGPPELLTREGDIGDLAVELEAEGGDLERGDDAVPAAPGYFLVSLTGPLLEEWRADLAGAGVDVVERAAGSSYVVRMSPSVAGELLALSFVSGVTRYGVAHTVAGGPRPADVPARPGRLVTWDLWLHRADDRPAVERELEARHVPVTGSGGRKIRVVMADGPTAADVASLPAVARMEAFVPPELHNDVARGLLGIDGPDGANGVRLTGRGQVVGVADTGIDAGHADLAGRIVATEALGRPGDASDPNGHGTHVAASVAGDGKASAGAFKGAAPKARIYFQSLLDASGRLGGLPVNLATMFASAYDAGARIHNNSWGSSTASRYTIDATEVDAFVAEHRDMLIVVSAGNDGLAEPRANAQPGFVDWLSIGSPAACKNALTVGAARGGRTDGGYAQLTWGELWPADYPAPPISAERVSGDPERLAAFSSRGPCDDRRIKPDVVAPGTDILSARSSTAPLRNFWGAHENPAYAYLGGTSMAAPLVAGTAALVREYLVERRKHQPSAALLKALLVNGTRWLSGPDSIADFADCPNYHQGFGAVHLPGSIPTPLDPGLKLEFVDGWQPDDPKLERTGQAFRYTVRASAGRPLRVCLAYTDLPGRGLQNNLNLTVEDPTGRRWLGNEDVPMSLRIPDPDNNVETVRIDDAPAGEYLIQVSAWNLLQAPQDFALVVAGALRGRIKAAA